MMVVGFFKAFATAGPTILLGAAYIAGIVAILGGGVAAAISLVALSLKLFFCCMKSLASVEWKKLSGVGSILGGLALGIGALVLGSCGGIGLVTAAVGLMALAVPLAIIARSSRAGDTFVKLAAGVTTLKSALKDFPLKEFKEVAKIGAGKGGNGITVNSIGKSEQALTNKEFSKTVDQATSRIIKAIEKATPSWNWLEFDKSYREYVVETN